MLAFELTYLKGLGVVDSCKKGFVMLYLVTPLFAIPATLSREVEVHVIGLDLGWATSLSGVTGRFDRWRPPCQLMTSMFWSRVEAVVGGGGVYHVFVLWLCMPRVP